MHFRSAAAVVAIAVLCSCSTTQPETSGKNKPNRRKPEIAVAQVDAGSNRTNLGYGIVLNEKSSMKRRAHILNQAGAPANISDVVIRTVYDSRSYGGEYNFKSSGKVRFSTDVQAFTVVHILFDVYGEHLRTLGETNIEDVRGETDYPLSATWRAWENDAGHYLTSVSYVRAARLPDGTIWTADLEAMYEKIRSIQPSLTREAVDLPKANPPAKEPARKTEK